MNNISAIPEDGAEYMHTEEHPPEVEEDEVDYDDEEQQSILE